MDKLLEKSIARAKIGIMQKPDTMFFSVLCSSLQVIIEDVGTAATDGENLYIDPKFWEVLTLDEQVFLLAHETLHIAYLHPTRKGNRDHQLFNMAADYVINLELAQRGFKVIGDLSSRGIQFSGALIDTKFKGWSTENVYQYLVDNPTKVPSSFDMPDLKPTKTKDIPGLEAKIQAKISRAIMGADLNKGSGSVPADIRRYYEELTKPVVNWKVVLHRFMTALSRDNYTWRKLNKRYPNPMPTLASTGLGRIDFAIDTSGSINAKQFNQFVSEVYAVMRMLQPKEIGLYQFDHVLTGSDILKNFRDIRTVAFKGGGGTRPQPAIDEFIKNKAQALIILTDGHFRRSELTDPKRPILWAIYNNPRFKPPFGHVIHFNI